MNKREFDSSLARGIYLLEKLRDCNVCYLMMISKILCLIFNRFNNLQTSFVGTQICS